MTSIDPRLWFPGSLRRAANPFLERAGLAGLALYAAMLTLNKDLCYAGEWLMLLALAGSWSLARDRIFKDTVFRLGLVWMAYLGVSCLVGAAWVPGSLGDQALAARRWAKLGFVVLVAWWLGGDWRAIRRLYFVLFIAFALAMLPYFLYPLYWEKGLSGGRLRFGMNPQRSALFFATALLGLLFLARDVWGHRSDPRFPPRIGLWALAVLLMTLRLPFTQTRRAAQRCRCCSAGVAGATGPWPAASSGLAWFSWSVRASGATSPSASAKSPRSFRRSRPDNGNPSRTRPSAAASISGTGAGRTGRTAPGSASASTASTRWPCRETCRSGSAVSTCPICTTAGWSCWSRRAWSA